MTAWAISRVQVLNARPVAWQITNARATLTPTPPAPSPTAGVAWVVTRAQATVTTAAPAPAPGGAWVITSARATVTPTASTAGMAWRLTQVRASITPVVMNAGTDRTNIEPGTTVTLIGSTTPVGVWTQTAGPAVTLTTAGANATYVARRALDSQTLQFTYSYAGVSSVVTHVVLPVTERAAVGGAWVPALIRGIGSTTV